MEQQEQTIARGELKGFEMRVIFSVILGTSLVGTTKDEKKDFIEYLIGEKIDKDRVLDYCQYIGPRIMNRMPDAEKLVTLLESNTLDKGRYRKICDMNWFKAPFGYATIEKPFSIE